MRIAEVLESKGSSVYWIAPEATVEDAIVELARHDVGALVVSHDGEEVLGIVSERDVVRRLARRREHLLEELVESIMTNAVHSCTPEDDTDTVRVVMTDQRVRHVPVLRDGVLVGIVSIGDVVKSSIDELLRDRDQLVEYISAR